ncbi:MAG: Vitamin K-dependent protein [bacterium]|nr:Vitamin K-dependent protein [bacterium]
MKRTSLGLCLLVPLAACTPSPPPTAQLGQAIINGTLDEGDPNIVMLFSQVPGSSSGFLCTCEVVSPHVVLTAAHCVAPTEVGAGAQFIVFTGTAFGSMPPPDQVLKVTETHYFPTFAYNPMTGGDQDDIAVVILEQPTTIAPLPFNHFPLPPSATGAAARIVGYGLTRGNDPQGTTAGTKHEAPTTVFHVEDTTITLYDKMHSNCEGDSGGPALLMLDGKERIAALTQVGYIGCPVNMASTSTRVDTYASFVDGYVTMFDPPAVAPAAACTVDTDCGSLPCLGGICAQPCDPKAATSMCPAGTTCSDVDGKSMCAKGSPHHGCAMGGAHDASGGALCLSLVAATLLLRRRRRA